MSEKPGIVYGALQADGSVLVAQTGRAGTELIACSHNYCDKTSWYSTSVRHDDQACSEIAPNDGTTWQPTSNNVPWVDLCHGKVLWEEDIQSSHLAVVKVDGVTLTEDPMYGAAQDYSIDYNTGTITFNSSQAGKTVTVSYSHVQDSHWVTKPVAGKKLIIEDAEIQFSADLAYNDAVVLCPYGYVQVFAPELWDGYDPPGPYPTNTLIPLTPRMRVYKRHDQILDEARGAYPIIGTVAGPGGHASERFGYPLIYKTVTELLSSAGMELHVYLQNNIVFGGERATVTFYGVEAAE